jgi:hypothetical protein
MADDDVIGALGPPGALKRPRYEVGDRLAAADLSAEQAWRRQRLRRHNRHLHGWGIVCGLHVVPALDAGRPWGLLVCPGYALGPYGDEMLVSCAAGVDIREWIWSRPADAGRLAYVAIRYADTSVAPRSVKTGECGCEGDRTRHSMITENWKIEVLWTLPERGTLPPFDLCHDLPSCAPCPPSPFVVLASVRVPADEGTTILRADIDLSVRVVI